MELRWGAHSQAIESVTHGHCDARPTVTFPANGRYQFILFSEQRHTVCEQLAESRYVERSGRDLNLRPLGCKSDALTNATRHTNIHVRVKNRNFCLISGWETLQCVHLYLLLLEH